MKTAEEKNKKNLDFIIIGSAKSGTTGLHNMLVQHPEIFMPKEKELPFFSDDNIYHNGYEWFYRKVYAKASSKKVKGKATPQYMEGMGTATPKVISSRIAQNLPKVKIIAVLRDPVERAHSFYTMSVRQQYEKKSFDVRVDELLRKDSLRNSRHNATPYNSYVVGGEYGRILKSYYNLFPNEQIKILFLNDLKNNPQKVLDELTNFIGVRQFDFNTKIDTYTGGIEPRFRLLTPGFLFKLPFVKKIWNNAVPFKLKRGVNASLNIWNTKPGKKGSIDEKTTQKLRRYYEKDKKVLEKLIGKKVPW